MIKQFRLGAKRYRVKVGKPDCDCLGMCNPSLCEITIRDKWEGRDIPLDAQEQTLYHEVTHAILDEIGRCDLYDDESFVQAFSTLLYQFSKTAK